MKTLYCLLAAVSLGLVAMTTEADAGSLTRTNPAHYGGNDSGANGTLPQPGLRDFRERKITSRVVLRRDQSLRDSGRPNRRLSQACREGQFRQTTEHRLIAIMDKRSYGAAIGNTSSLYDPQRRGQDGIVYAFVGQGTTNCRVYQLGAANAG